MVKPTLIDLNPAKLKYYPFTINLDKCTGSCNVLSPKICIPKETRDINVKAFNIITNKNGAKTMTKHILCDCKCKSQVQHVIQIKTGITKRVNVKVKITISEKNIIVEMLADVFVRIASI